MDDRTKIVLTIGGVAGAYYLAREMTRDKVAYASTGSPASSGETPTPQPPPPSGAGVSRKYDHLFEKHGAGLPTAYLRALAKRESNMDPNDTQGPAWGLMQVVEVVRHDFNQRHGTSYTRQDLLDPDVNIMMCTDLLRRIIAGYKQHHPNVPNLQPDWNNPRFVELLTCGWNAGYSEVAGVGKVARYLEDDKGITDITVDTIFEHSAAAGGVKFLREEARRKWWKSVARLYFEELARDAAGS